jgi:hypothetical protein
VDSRRWLSDLGSIIYRWSGTVERRFSSSVGFRWVRVSAPTGRSLRASERVRDLLRGLIFYLEIADGEELDALNPGVRRLVLSPVSIMP